eukprot:CAMPEP_0115889332 /NCGR_PEP_ID=MMETSP0287-20121206/32772_1 /TAXON_ID=412157 /ORGANISM="Chrysochromulina rotalis, Strain UIO044" /LENGTH=50 /DNA_ID=CAMNT_0003346051 /DNA_START=82 /DNA_END=235 /DNA_ORIENTATION=-
MSSTAKMGPLGTLAFEGSSTRRPKGEWPSKPRWRHRPRPGAPRAQDLTQV